MGPFLTPRFELGQSLHTGTKHLDDDHRELIDHVNLIAEAEQCADQTRLVEALVQFKTRLAEHFQTEEANLIAANYPKASAHAKHHSEIIATLERLTQDARNGEPTEGVAYICYHELVSAVLLRDMQFLNWLADNRMWNRR